MLKGQSATLVLLLLTLLPPLSFAQDSISTTEVRPSMLAHRVGGGVSIRLDGLLDESVWAQASPITQFRQQEPVEGGGAE